MHLLLESPVSIKVLPPIKEKESNMGTEKPKYEPLPFYAKIQIGIAKGVPAEVIGKTGIIFGRAQNTRGRWNYSVRVDGMESSYYLPQIALTPTGEILHRRDLYSGATAKVLVDQHGNGHIAL